LSASLPPPCTRYLNERFDKDTVASKGALHISPGGRFLIAVDAGSNQLSVVSRYSIARGGVLTLLGSTLVRGTSVGAVNARLSPGGRFLYVEESTAGAVAEFAVHGGNLTELASSPAPLPAGATPAGIVVTWPACPGGHGTSAPGFPGHDHQAVTGPGSEAASPRWPRRRVAAT